MADRASSRLVVVVGMVREARIVEAAGVSVGISGGHPSQLSLMLDQALEDGVAGIISFGLCGGLDPDLNVGDLIIDSDDAAWRGRLTSTLPYAREGTVTGGEAMIASVSEKENLRRRSGAAAVDMETHVVKALARRFGTPCAVLRAVSDAADRALPRAALAGLKANGEADIPGVLGALARRPWQLPALLRTAKEADAAFRALRNARDLLGPGLGCPYFVEHLVDVS